MSRQRRLPGLAAGLAALAFGSAAAAAETVASYASSNGTVAPPYRWDMSADIAADGRVTVTYCLGYQPPPERCGIASDLAPEGAVAAILAAAEAAELFSRPVAEQEDIPVGGGITRASVSRDGQRADLPAFPLPGEAARLAPVYAAILAAIPPGLVASAEAKAPPPP